MASEATCPVCESGDRARAFIEKDGWPLFLCDDCDHIFVQPFPSREEMASP
ncbi:MAG: hypothetical protein QNK04_16300 [Myxococcota bacterium]|nr:hypothetical protein [Myxococcota bacterium]